MKIQQLNINMVDGIKDKTSNDIWQEFESNVTFHNKFFEKLDAKYIWNFDSDVVLSNRLNDAKNIENANQIIWTDMLQSIGAAEQIFYRRANAILSSIIILLKDEDYLSTAILARSLLELTIWNVYHSATFDASIKSINKSYKKNLIDPKELQEILLKLIWGTNLKGVEQELKQHKVIKICEKVAKAVKNDTRQKVNLEEVYNKLCEYVHPNVEGNNLFLNFDINAMLKPVSTIEIVVGQNQNPEKKVNPIDCILEALNWCLPAKIFASQKYTNSRRMIISTFELTKRNKPTIH